MTQPIQPTASKFELMWFQQDFSQPGWPVRINIRITTPFGAGETVYGVDLTTDEATLKALATARKRATWDETDVMKWVEQDKGQAVTLPRPGP